MSGAGPYADERERRLHVRYRLLAAAAVDGRIDADDAADLEAHLLTCDACSAELAAIQADHRLLAEPARVAAPDPRVRVAVLDAARGPRVPRVGAPSRPWTAVLAAGLAVSVVAAGILLGLRTPPGPGSSPQSSTLTSIPPTASAVTTTGCISIPPGLSARWHFDSPGEYLTGQPISFGGDVEFVEGISATAIRLSGSTASATFEDGANLDFGTVDFTISLWVRLASTSDEQVLLERFSQAPLEGWSLTKIETRQVRLAVATDQGELDIDSAGALIAGPWQHVVARRSGDRFSLFINGVLAGSAQLAPGARADLGTELPLLFGRRGDDRGYHLNGDLDEVLAWTGFALTDEQIADLHRVADAGFCEAAAGAGYEGAWATVDCATRGEIVACEQWGDGSNLELVIGPGERPTVTFADELVEGCAGGSRRASGTAHFEGVYLWVVFVDIDCAASSESWSNPMQLYKGLGDDTIWLDPDGDNWGLVYRRA